MTPTHCLHCSHRMRNRGTNRVLCWACHYRPEIRSRYVAPPSRRLKTDNQGMPTRLDKPLPKPEPGKLPCQICARQWPVMDRQRDLAIRLRCEWCICAPCQDRVAKMERE